MDYNTSKEKLIIPEYGRNVQSLIRFAVTVEDREYRNKIARYVIELMAQITNPAMRTVEEFRRKLWDHLFIISDFKLDVDSPYPLPTADSVAVKGKSIKMRYPNKRIKYRHYGNSVETMIRKAVEMEDPAKQRAFAEVIGNYMKLVYQNWNRENITDEVIMSDFEMISGGKLTLQKEANLDSLARSTRRSKPRPSGKSGGGRSGGHRNKGGYRHKRGKNN